jgi:hypothetical protein
LYVFCYTVYYNDYFEGLGVVRAEELHRIPSSERLTASVAITAELP